MASAGRGGGGGDDMFAMIAVVVIVLVILGGGGSVVGVFGGIEQVWERVKGTAGSDPNPSAEPEPEPEPEPPAPEPPAPEPPAPEQEPAPPRDDQPGCDRGSTHGTLNCLRIEPRPKDDGSYDRDSFGDGWKDPDGNGCDGRRDALHDHLDTAQPHKIIERRGCAHYVIAGTWHDPLTGETLIATDLTDQKQAQHITVEHTVALQEAHYSGARHWTTEQRVAFANDPLNLTIASQAVNSAKGGDDPAAWRPKKPFQCDYATRVITVKDRYDLAVDRREKAALADMLRRC